MRTEKTKAKTLYAWLTEADRTMYKDENGEWKANGENKDTVSKSKIDFDKSDGNYNVCPHAQYTYKEVQQRCRDLLGCKPKASTNMVGGTILTLPEELRGESKEVIEDFFTKSYEILKNIYKIDDADVVSAYVHMDETNPHMHFYFIPHYRDLENGKEGLSWEYTVPRAIYKKQHKLLQDALKEQGYEVSILNGKTQGFDKVSTIPKADREKYAKMQQDLRELESQNTELKADNNNLRLENETRQLELDDTRAELYLIKEEKKNVTMERDSIKSERDNLNKEVTSLQNTLENAREEMEEIKREKSMLEALKREIESLWARFYKWTQDIIPKLEIEAEKSPQKKSWVIKAKKELKTVGGAIVDKNLGKAKNGLDKLDESYHREFDDEYER